MRILHVAPLWFPVSRDSTGGIETFLAALIGALDRAGCRNTLLAAGDSRVAAEIVPVIGENLCAQMQEGRALEYVHYEQHQLRLAFELAPAFDVVHSHLGPPGLVLSAMPTPRVLHSWHTQIYRDMAWFVGRRPDLHLCAVSDFQARLLVQAGATRCSVIPNGIEVSAFPFRPEASGPGLLFLGRMEAPKGGDLAIGVARTLDRPLTLAGPIVDREFFRQRIEPYLDGQITYVGTVDHGRKSELLGQAACLLAPSRVAEAFGVVSVEAMACGTPVVALASGALPELIETGLTGFTSPDPQALPSLVTRAERLDRAAIRARAVARFDISAVAGGYRRLYDQLAARVLREL